MDDFSAWLQRGKGLPPTARWSVGVDGRLVGMSVARETGLIVAADESGTLTSFDRGGRTREISRGWKQIRSIHWADAADAGVLVSDDALLTRLDASLNPVWSVEFTSRIEGAAISPFGQFAAVALSDRSVFVLGPHKQRVAQFDVGRPFAHLLFVAEERWLVGAAEYGLFGLFTWKGDEFFTERLMTNIGGLAATGNGGELFVAGFGHGVQAFDAEGENTASYVVEGNVQRVSVSYSGERIAASTIENHVYWADEDGQLLWASQADRPVIDIVCDPLGEWLICGLEDGTLLRLDWNSAK